LDAACCEHDIIYSHNKDLTKHNTLVADNILTAKALKRITARDSTLGEKERIAATIIWAAMKTKTKIGMDLKMKKKKATSK